ncbi:MAG: rhomboid family intramembrane serine protease, partial [Acidobacteria bacterium]|nr:rhomboid family intramembrane serine protease [Acidobacteriota bacterium]
MRSRYPSSISYSIGPGPLTYAIKAIVIANVAAFLLDAVVPAITLAFGLRPADVVERLQIWQPITYMFLHGGIFHLLFNMLALWMFGVELERMWGSRYFTKFYFVAGGGAALTTILLSFLPFSFSTSLYNSLTIGASGAVYGVLLAYAMYFPNRPIYMYFFFPIPAKYFVMIMGGISLYSSMSATGGGIAHTTHLGGLVAAYLYLKGGRTNLMTEIRYRLMKWRINRSRRRFDVYSGGRSN